MSLKVFFLLIFLSSLTEAAFASYLRISPMSNLQLRRTASEVQISGIYSIVNEGDEPAQNVYPVFSLDRSQIQLDAQTVFPKQKISWDLQWHIPIENLCTENWDDCLAALPADGKFLIRILSNYQDRNGFHFSNPEFLILSSDFQKPPESSIEIQVERAAQNLPNHQLEARYAILNHSAESAKANLRAVMSKELKVVSGLSDQPLEIPAQGKVDGSIVIESLKGATNLQSAFILTAEWAWHGEREAEAASLIFQMEDPEKSRNKSGDLLFWGWLGIAMAFGLIGTWAFWIRPLSKLRKTVSI